MTGPVNTAFTYDAFGRREQSTTGGNNISYLDDGANVAQEQQGGNATATYLLGPAFGQRYARTDANGTLSYLTDALGSVFALSSSTGGVQSSYIYDPFGNTTTSGIPSVNPYQYAGQEIDGTGLILDFERLYSPNLGRFISQDPIGILGSGINLYSYAHDNPINYTDPTGLAAVKDGYSSFLNPGFFTGPFNTLYGTYKIFDGVALLLGGTAEDVTGLGAVLGIPTQAYGWYQLTSGGFRFYNGFRQLYGAMDQPHVCTTVAQYFEQGGWNIAPFGGLLQYFLGGGISPV